MGRRVTTSKILRMISMSLGQTRTRVCRRQVIRLVKSKWRYQLLPGLKVSVLTVDQAFKFNVRFA